MAVYTAQPRDNGRVLNLKSGIPPNRLRFEATCRGGATHAFMLAASLVPWALLIRLMTWPWPQPVQGVTQGRRKEADGNGHLFGRRSYQFGKNGNLNWAGL